MPTSRHRYQLTETPDVEEALDLARRRWPGESRSKLLRRVIHVGKTTLKQEESEAARARIAAIRATSGKYDFPDNFLADLRKDWPE